MTSKPIGDLPITELKTVFSQGRSTRKLCHVLGLGTPAQARAGIYRDVENNTTWFRWMGRNGNRWRHQFENDPWYEMSQSEWDSLKVKVTLSQC